MKNENAKSIHRYCLYKLSNFQLTFWIWKKEKDWFDQRIRLDYEKWIKKSNHTMSLCISLIVGKYPSKSEHLNGKTATIGTFFQGTTMILHKKMPY